MILAILSDASIQDIFHNSLSATFLRFAIAFIISATSVNLLWPTCLRFLPVSSSFLAGEKPPCRSGGDFGLAHHPFERLYGFLRNSLSRTILRFVCCFLFASTSVNSFCCTCLRFLSTGRPLEACARNPLFQSRLGLTDPSPRLTRHVFGLSTG
jgi:hypothetical protein